MSDLNYVEFKPETRKWMFWLARIFGKRSVGVDGDTRVVMCTMIDIERKVELTAERARSIKLVEALNRIALDCESFSNPDEREALILRCMNVADNAIDAHNEQTNPAGESMK